MDNAPITKAVDPQALQEELDACRKKADEYLNGWKRAKADFINREKDFSRQQEGMIAFTMHRVLESILPSFEALEKACAALPTEAENGEWGKGVLAIRKNFEKALTDLGVTKMETMKKPFDPMHHEVVSRRKEEGVASGTIVEEVRPGYLFQKNVLIHAKVIVAE